MAIFIFLLCFVNCILLIITLQKDHKIVTNLNAWLKSQELKNRATWENWCRYDRALNVYIDICNIFKKFNSELEPCVMLNFMEASGKKILYRIENGVDWLVIANNLRAEYRKNGINVRAVAHNGTLTVTFL